MAVEKRKKKVKKIKYRKVSFKLTDKQKKVIERFCRLKRTTPTRMMKAAIKDYLIRHAASMPEEDYISENQLKLFDDDLELVEEEELLTFPDKVPCIK
ncbi:MAG: hypothetical protein AB9842_09065 [Bacteroidales bacterium]